jgi:hypothetical protein
MNINDQAKHREKYQMRNAKEVGRKREGNRVTKSTISHSLARSSPSQSNVSKYSLDSTLSLQLPVIPIPKPDIAPLLAEDVIPMFQNWTPESFPKIEFEGRLRPWIDIYIQEINIKWCLFSIDYLQNHANELPMYLLHTMYALALACTRSSSDVHCPGDGHHTYGKLLLSEEPEKDSLLYIAAMLLSGIYGSIYTHALVAAVSAISACASKLGELGVYTRGCLVTDDNAIFSSIQKTKKFCQLLIHLTIQTDFHITLLRKIPGMIDLERLRPECIEYIDDGEHYNDFYDSLLWRYEILLFRVGNRIISLHPFPVENSEKIPKEYTDCLKELERVVGMISSASKPHVQFDGTAVDGFQFYLNLMGHSLRLLLCRPFLDLLRTKRYQDREVLEIIQHSKAVTALGREFLKHPKANQQVPIVCHSPFLIASTVFKSLNDCDHYSNQFMGDLVVCYQVVARFAEICRTYHFRAEELFKLIHSEPQFSRVNQ